MTVITSLSGNDFTCLVQKNYLPGNIIIGNSIHSLGFAGKIESRLTGVLGQEIKDITSMLKTNRQNAYERMLAIAQSSLVAGVINVKSELLFHNSNLEFITTGAAITALDSENKTPLFSASVDGKELYALLDAEYVPLAFVFGNVAYATAMSSSLIGKLSTFKKGEVKSLSETFNQTRRLALARLVYEAREKKANAVIDIKTTTQLFTGVNEILMRGTAAQHFSLPASHIMTSTLSTNEAWNLAQIGYAPKQVLIGSSIFSVGLPHTLSTITKSFYQKEIPELTDLFDQGRKQAFAILRSEAKAINAKTVMGMKMHIHQLGNGLIEFLAMGTAVEKLPGIKTISSNLPTAVFQTVRD